MTVQSTLENLSSLSGFRIDSDEFASYLDSQDKLAACRSKFIIPKRSKILDSALAPGEKDEDCLYLCSNSLGLQPVRTRELINQELDVWANKGVFGHLDHPLNRPWVSIGESVVPFMAEVVGAKPIEVAVMATLTTNLHNLLTAFYKPTQTRYKILIEDRAFPSDHYAIESQIRVKGFNPEKAMLTAKLREGESIFRMEDIIEIIKEQGDSIALILLPGVQYYSGQVFDMKTITQVGHEAGCIVGFDLAHAVGNILLELHDWDVDFACWCSYKYLSSGPGNIGGLFVHEKFANDHGLARLTGWWAHRLETRFQMSNVMELSPGAQGFLHSNPSVTNCVALLGSLEIYHEFGMAEFRKKSVLLTGLLEHLVLNNATLKGKVKIMTPSQPESRGCQLSLLIDENFEEVFAYLCNNGVICDERHPNCIRVGPYPFVNTFSEMVKFVDYLVKAVKLQKPVEH